jgi:hypothetical protein
MTGKGYEMSNGEMVHPDLEALQRWAIVVDDQLREAANAVVALEDPNAEPISDGGDDFNPAHSSGDLAAVLIEEINTYKDNPDRPVWFTPAFQMVLAVSGWANFLMDYVDETDRHGSMSYKQLSLIDEKIDPAIDHYFRFLKAVHAAGYLSTQER